MMPSPNTDASPQPAPAKTSAGPKLPGRVATAAQPLNLRSGHTAGHPRPAWNARRTGIAAVLVLIAVAVVAIAMFFPPWPKSQSGDEANAAAPHISAISTNTPVASHVSSDVPAGHRHPATTARSPSAPPASSSKFPVAPGTARMADRLRAMNEMIHLETFSYRNDKLADKLKLYFDHNSLESIPANLHIQYFYVLLLAGQTREALAHHDRIAPAFKDPRSRIPPQMSLAMREHEAIAYFRLAEQENCLQRPCCFSCIFPLEREAVHTMTEGSENAIKAYTALLQDYPNNLTYRWLLNLAYQTLGRYPHDVPARWVIPPAAFKSDYELPRFTDAAADAGLADVDLAGGVCMDDFDGDGRWDIVRSSFGVDRNLKFFHNNGDGTFTDRTEQALLTGEVGGLNITHADYDNDGHLDILVLRGGWVSPQGRFPNSLLRNRGDGTFEDVTEAAGLLSFHPTQVGAWGDYDADGDLDLFIGNESNPEDPHPCELYRNNGNGAFTEVAAEMGVDHTAYVKGAAWGDYDNDGRLDLYVSNMGAKNVLFHNDGHKFTDVTEKAGGLGEPFFSFPCWFFDYDNDGWQDIYVAQFLNTDNALDAFVKEYLGQPVDDFGYSRLYRNRGDGTFEDVSKPTRAARPMMAMGGSFGDLDNDGYLDFYLGTGNPRFSALIPNRMFRNDAGRTFQDVTTAGGFGHLQKGHGVAFGDLDNDGDQDVFIVMGGAYTGDVFRCVLFDNPISDNHYLRVRVRGAKSNRYGVGARMKVVVADATGREREIHRTVGGTGSFGSNPMELHVGLGKAQRVVSLNVHWPATGKTDRYTNVPLDACVQLTEGNAKLESVPLKNVTFGGGTPTSTLIDAPKPSLP